MSDRSKEVIFPNIYAPDDAWLARAVSEPVREPDLKIIDTHFHLSEFDGHEYMLNEFCKDIVDCGHRIEASVFVECGTQYATTGPDHLKPVGETRYITELTARRPHGITTDIAPAIVAFADLTQGELSREALLAHIDAAKGRLRGIRHRAKWDADPRVKGSYSADSPHLYLQPAFSEGMKHLSELGLSFDASVYHPQIPDVTALARAHPEVKIILIHSGSPVGHSSYAGREQENHANWLASMTELARCPNAYVKLGGVLMNLANFDFLKAEAPPTSEQLARLWRPYIEPCIELFGAARCMVSSNFPVDKAGFSYATVWNMFKRITEGCSAQEKEQIFSGTARQVYRIGE
ncbi:amidohydrolase family protein [Advenella mimigardefordensis]|uniref:Putative amidohydrolase 2 n=1 Tax=Advenella mimigardefordensis (strain DSM 17166 / LMG 22922 / DPN7) TaxID=1247726 RepID=W0PBB5_ADVMD|nr:amidohydrolase family protein [Advenella mimigardefordensis]AHG64159.1 putative amidohydrolase 2 [Advenella mimigardefordensis DPN7]